MQDYIDLAEKNGVTLLERGMCQFCGAQTARGVHECVEIFSLGFEWMDYSKPENHFYRFLSVDAHTLQHPEIHGRWNNHFHLLRQRLIFEYEIAWNYQLSPKLSDHLNAYKAEHANEFLQPPDVLKRGNITTTYIQANCNDEAGCRDLIWKWGLAVYESWKEHHKTVDTIALDFVDRNSKTLRHLM